MDPKDLTRSLRSAAAHLLVHAQDPEMKAIADEMRAVASRLQWIIDSTPAADSALSTVILPDASKGRNLLH